MLFQYLSLALIPIALFALIKNRADAYHRRQQAITEHERKGDIHYPKAGVPLRDYVVFYKKDGQELNIKLQAPNIMDAKLAFMKQTNEPLESFIRAV